MFRGAGCYGYFNLTFLKLFVVFRFRLLQALWATSVPIKKKKSERHFMECFQMEKKCSRPEVTNPTFLSDWLFLLTRGLARVDYSYWSTTRITLDRPIALPAGYVFLLNTCRRFFLLLVRCCFFCVCGFVVVVVVVVVVAHSHIP